MAVSADRKRARLTGRDRDLLEFMALHRLVLADHVATLLGTSTGAAYARLRTLSRAGLTAKEALFNRQPPCHQITARGLAVIGSDLSPPRLDARGYRHDAGVAWLWLAARDGAFGQVEEIVSERELRSGDGRRGSLQEPIGVRLGGVGPRGRERVHYPDLLLTLPGGKRVAVELELTPKGGARREKILAGYGADARIAAVLYLVEDRSVGEAVRASARRLGITALVNVQKVRLNPDVGFRARAGLARERGRRMAVGASEVTR